MYDLSLRLCLCLCFRQYLLQIQLLLMFQLTNLTTKYIVTRKSFEILQMAGFTTVMLPTDQSRDSPLILINQDDATGYLYLTI